MRVAASSFTILFLLMFGSLSTTDGSQALEGGPTPRYSIQVLDLANHEASLAKGLNQAGEVVGWFGRSVSMLASISKCRSFLYRNGRMYDIGEFHARGINDLGQIAGWIGMSGAGSAVPERAIIWEHRKITHLGMAPKAGPSCAFQINNRGLVVGALDNRACFWLEREKYVPHMLEFDNYGLAQAVNDRGTAVGFRHWSAFLYSRGQIKDLGTFGWIYSEAHGVNNRDQIVGELLWRHIPGHSGLSDTDTDYSTRAFLYTNGTITDLGTLGGRTNSANAINDRGQVVGSSWTPQGERIVLTWTKGDLPAKDNPNHAFLWENGTMKDLNNLVRMPGGWILNEAVAINNRGQIIGSGFIQGKEHAFLLTPIFGGVHQQH